MSRRSHAPRRRTAATTLVLAACLGPLIGGCSTRNDPHFNPYASGGGEPTVLERAEQAVQTIERALDNLDERQENIVY